MVDLAEEYEWFWLFSGLVYITRSKQKPRMNWSRCDTLALEFLRSTDCLDMEYRRSEEV